MTTTNNHDTHQTISSYISGLEGGQDKFWHLVKLTEYIKTHAKEIYQQAPLKGKVITALFLNPSLRTRTSLESGVFKLGGHLNVLNVGGGNGTWGVEFQKGVVMNQDKAEHIIEAAGVLSSYSDLLAMRSFASMQNFELDMQDQAILALRRYAKVPVLSLESACYHPCQSLADAVTLKSYLGDTQKKKFTLAWSPHPKMCGVAVPHSALLAAARLGMDITVAHPKGYELEHTIMQTVEQVAHDQGGTLAVSHDLHAACDQAEVVYAKAWGAPIDYGSIEQGIQRNQHYHDWTLSDRYFDVNQQAFMHCLPVRRGVVVSDHILDSSASLVQTQAENRLWTQMALLLDLLDCSPMS